MKGGLFMKPILTVFAIAGLVAIAACGETTGERALSGGAIGAGAGAAAGAVTGMGIGTGAILGGAAGAATGALTDEDQIDLDN
jgi:osmotically inducible lipoprotein OsmB